MNWRFWDRTGGAGGDGCAAIEPLLSLYTDGMASPAEARRVEAHLQDCDGCRQALGWMQATRRVIAARPAVPPPTDLRFRIARAIAEADGVVPAPVRRALPARRPLALRPALAYGLSFALLAALSGSLFWNAGHQPATAVHPGQRPAVVAVRPADTGKAAIPTAHPRPRPADPELAAGNVPVPHIPRVPLFRFHLPQPDVSPDFSTPAISDSGDAGSVRPAKHAPALHPVSAVKAPVTAHVHHAPPTPTTPAPGDEHLAVKPKSDNAAPPKKSPVAAPPTLEANNRVPPPDVTPEPPAAPRIIIQQPTITPEAPPVVHEASLTDTLRDSVRHMHETALTSHSFKLSSSLVEAAGVSSDRSGTAVAVGAGFGR